MLSSTTLPISLMTYQDAYNYVLSFNNLRRKKRKAGTTQGTQSIKQMRHFLSLLNNPQHNIPHYVHVTGTSGKGSTTAYMHSILHAAGYKVGSTYSPHPSTIRERWRINNTFMSEKEFVSLIQQLQPILDRCIQQAPYDVPTFLEICHAIAFLWFAQQKVDYAVIEVGCGGRYDATNVLPYTDVAIITNIGLDHLDLLGDTKEKIAYEKAGIIKKDSHVITAEKQKNLRSMFESEYTKQHAASFTAISLKQAQIITQELQGIDFLYEQQRYHLPVSGTHQIENALVCIEAAKKLGIPLPSIQKGLQNAVQPLRLELLTSTPLFMVDGAHNNEKIRSTVETLLSIKNRQPKLWKELHLIICFSENKKITTLITLLARLEPKSIACTRDTMNPFRAVAFPADVARMCKKKLPNARIQAFVNPTEALAWSRSQQKTKDLLLVTGSIFLSGQIRAIVKDS